jgi:hypothetical protein
MRIGTIGAIVAVLTSVTTTLPIEHRGLEHGGVAATGSVAQLDAPDGLGFEAKERPGTDICAQCWGGWGLDDIYYVVWNDSCHIGDPDCASCPEGQSGRVDCSHTAQHYSSEVCNYGCDATSPSAAVTALKEVLKANDAGKLKELLDDRSQHYSLNIDRMAIQIEACSLGVVFASVPIDPSLAKALVPQLTTR